MRLAVIAVVAALVLGGCSADPGTGSQPDRVESALMTVDLVARAAGMPGILRGGLKRATARLVPAGEPDVSGVWTGRYLCPQGVTGLTLTIAQRRRRLDARFEFYSLPINPGLSPGSYLMSGTIEDRIVVLDPERWLIHPPGWYMVGLAVTPDPEFTDRMTGIIMDEGCGAVTIDRR
ncbi:MAG: hypothetical protein AB7G21_07055 [Dehalococcoidia bacterium]